MKKLGIVITGAEGVRNYILSNLMNEASQQFGTIVIYSGLPKITFLVNLPLNFEIE